VYLNHIKKHNSQKAIVYCKVLIEILAHYGKLHVPSMIEMKFKQNDGSNSLVQKSSREKD